MEKIKLTQEQKDRIDFLLSDWAPGGTTTIEEILLRTHELVWKETQNRCLNDLSLDSLARVLYTPNSYEVIPQYKVGDWVVNIHTAEIGQVEKINKVEGSLGNNERIVVNSVLNYPDSLRHATPEEIQQEKKRRFWDKLGREVDEWKDGDIVSSNGVVTHLSYGEIMKGIVNFPPLNFRSDFDISIEKIRLVVPVEQRLDK